jgi:bacterioferritin (cytochrome b1)
MQHTDIDTLRDVMTQQLKLIAKFQGHVQLIAELGQDEKVNVFLEHLLEEEAEHAQKVEALLKRLDSPSSPSVAPEEKAFAPAPVDPSGHSARRDQNILTVGSLYGMKQ